MDTGLLILICFTALAAFVQGFCGFGYGILLMAQLSFASSQMERASVFVTLSIIPLLIVLILRSRHVAKIDWKQGLYVSGGMLVCIPIGYGFVYTYGSMPIFRMVFGAALMLFALNGMCRPHIKRKIPSATAPVFGGFSGVLSGAFSSGGPPLVLYFYAQEDDPRQAVGTLQIAFLFAAFYRLFVVVAFGGGLSWDLTLKAVLVTPSVLILTVVAHILASRTNRAVFVKVVHSLILCAGIVNVVKGF
ncbi:MAG: sulfite exporter TauE/SafE family protein [Candidatus Pacebacteria bacterium]|nr:sulfite exporter TauE/SafE family protein [Candidatus Paceibacterota bacterium]